jgi:hypothetical protein
LRLTKRLATDLALPKQKPYALITLAPVVLVHESVAAKLHVEKLRLALAHSTHVWDNFQTITAAVP